MNPDNVHRHTQIGQMTRNGIRAIGLSLFPEENIASDTVTAVNVPDSVDAARLLAVMRDEHNVVLAGGQETLSGKIFRIGHMGNTIGDDIQHVLDALAVVLPQVGFNGNGAAFGRS